MGRERREEGDERPAISWQGVHSFLFLIDGF